MIGNIVVGEGSRRRECQGRQDKSGSLPKTECLHGCCIDPSVAIVVVEQERVVRIVLAPLLPLGLY